METRTGGLEVSYTAHGVPTYRLELWHDVRFAPNGLNRSRGMGASVR
jgi:hypothetical protein